MEIKIKKSVVEYLCNQADRGYEVPYKEERLGFLFGKISKAYYYKGGIRKRTKAEYHPIRVIKREEELSSIFRVRWIGMHHSHEEIDGRKSWGLLPLDRNSPPYFPVELLISVWVKGNRKIPSPGKFRLKILRNNYQYLFTGYIRTVTGLKPVKVISVKD